MSAFATAVCACGRSDTTETVGRTEPDVIVVGGGNAGFCAAHAAADEGARVLLLEKAPAAAAGGNSFYTAGAFRVAHGGAEALAPVFDDETTAERLPATDLDPYSAADFRADLERITSGRCDPVMADQLVDESEDLPRWLAAKGIRWRLMYERQSYERDGRWVFWGGLALGTVDGGKGLIDQHTRAAERAGVELRYDAAVTGLLTDGRAVDGVRLQDGEELRATATVLAAGGFESDPGRRAEHLGPGWEAAIVRGTPTNTGEVLDAALAAGAQPHGDWASCHSVAWDAGAPPQGGERRLTNQLTRQSYPLGIVVNARGERFLDEGADFRNYTYAKYGREILRQPGGIAHQVFDARTRPLLRTEEYDSTPITAAEAGTIRELAEALDIDPDGLERTVAAFNAAIVERPFDPAVKDGRAAAVEPPKSNWAMAIAQPPFYGFAVACGITFTFGGVHVDADARVLGGDGQPLPGLFAAGELVGGLFSGNYPGGSGLTAGAVYGRRAGAAAARQARNA
jgi:tricarballylate dehydrogenase